MRPLLLFAALLSACSSEQSAPPDVPNGVFVGAGRDALCISGSATALRAGVIAYGEGGLNCSASGRLDAANGALALVPSGEDECRFPLAFAGGTVTIGAVPAACAYYCAPGATLAGKSFRQSPNAEPVTDLAGESLC